MLDHSHTIAEPFAFNHDSFLSELTAFNEQAAVLAPVNAPENPMTAPTSVVPLKPVTAVLNALQGNARLKWKELKTAAGLTDSQLSTALRTLILDERAVGTSSLRNGTRIYFLK